MADHDFHRRDRMVERQIGARGVRDPRVLEAMRAVPREAFVPEHLAASAYDDTALPIGEGQTISQPYIVAAMIEASAIGAGDRVLEVGAGSGYAAAVLSRMAREIFAVERHRPLAEAARARLMRLGHDNVTVVVADGSGGLPEQAPFDAILVSARAPQVPDALRRQLRIGGRLVIPVGAAHVQALRRITRVGENEWDSDDLMWVGFVPLIGEYGIADER